MNKIPFYEEKIAKGLMYLSVLIVVYCVVSVVGAILQRGIPVLSWEMVSEVPGGGFFIGGKGGFLNAIVGSLYIVGGSTILGLLIALPVVFYLNVYLKPTSRFAAVARLAFDALFGIPSIVYGAFATIPILMVLLQYTSLLILIGAEMSYAIQNNEEFEYEHDLSQMSRRYKDFITLYLLSIIIKRFEADEAPLTAHQLAIRDHLPIRLVNQLLSRLVETGVLREVFVEDEEDRTYQPALDTHKISVGMVIERIESQGTELFLQQPSQEMETFWESYLEMLQNHRELNKVPVSSL